MKIPNDKILPIFLRYGTALIFFVTIFGILFYYDFVTVRDPYTWDENLYRNVSNNFTIEHLQYVYNNVIESKPLTFLVLQKVLNNSDPFYTRGLNLILIIISTYLIYKITNNKLSFLYITIPLFLGSMWLTDEMIEVVFILLSIQYTNRSGIFIGLATIFRPSALLYSVLIKIRQILNVFIVGTLFALILLLLGLFFPYLFEVTHYVGNKLFGLDPFVLVMLIFLIIMGLNKKMLGYIIISAIPLGMMLYPHYFLPVYTFLFVGFLLNMNDDIKAIYSNKNKKIYIYY
jgi:hypothetical protein